MPDQISAAVSTSNKVKVDVSSSSNRLASIKNQDQTVRQFDNPAVRVDILGPNHVSSEVGGAGSGTSESTVLYEAGEALTAGMIVYLDPITDTLKIAKSTISECSNRVIGVIVVDVDVGDDISVKREGLFETPAYNFPTLNRFVFLGRDGFPTSTPPEEPTDLFVLIVGSAISLNKINLEIRETFFFE